MVTTEAVEQTSAWIKQLRAALEKAEPNVLRMVLYHFTGDESLADMQLDVKLERGGVYRTAVLAPQHHEEIRQRLFELLCDGPIDPPPPPPREQLRHMMEMFSASTLSDTEAAYCAEELAFEEYPRDATWTKRPPAEVLAKFHVGIIGAGVSGISAALQFQRLGIPFTIYERQAGIGGTWLLNDYPDVRVDVSSFIYQFSSVKNYPWPEYYSRGAENIKYLDHVIDRFGLREHIVLNTELTGAVWNEDKAKWELGLTSKADGSATHRDVNVLISGSGLFATPNLADFPGIADFKGRVFHTTNWDHEYDIEGKNVALIGTGSTGTQLAPHIASKAKRLTVYQRTPSWMSGISIYHDRVPNELHWLFDNVPYYWNWFCYSGSLAMVYLQPGQVIDREWQKAGGQISKINDNFRKVLIAHIEERLEGRPDLIMKCTPKYAPLGRRMVVAGGWFDTLRRDNVDLVSETITHIGPNGIVTADGKSRDTDLIILASGFKVSKYLWPVAYVGRNGTTLEKAWEKDGARAYLGMVMPDFPNFLILYGPNGQPRTGSFHSWAEVWARYAGSAVVEMLERGATSIDCKREVFQRYNDQMDALYKDMVWESEGKGSYHVNEHGRAAVSIPWPVDIYHSWVRHVNPDDYEFR
jgi:4-hydroxyacetophenone monooxygenase